MPLWRENEAGLLLTLRVRPGARTTAVEGLIALPQEGVALQIKVAAPAENGKANEAVIALLAKSLRLPRQAVELRSGHKSRLKRLQLHGASALLAARLTTWIEKETA
jgi:uncharacterized protein (TIGR00251 family)